MMVALDLVGAPPIETRSREKPTPWTRPAQGRAVAPQGWHACPAKRNMGRASPPGGATPVGLLTGVRHAGQYVAPPRQLGRREPQSESDASASSAASPSSRPCGEDGMGRTGAPRSRVSEPDSMAWRTLGRNSPRTSARRCPGRTGRPRHGHTAYENGHPGHPLGQALGGTFRREETADGGVGPHRDCPLDLLQLRKGRS